MICLHPKRVNGTMVPCQQCPVCRQNYRQGLTSRFVLESLFCGSSFFVTLTYDEENLPRCLAPNQTESSNSVWEPCFNKHHIDLFLKSLRKITPLRFFCTAEHGDNFERPHYHLCLFLDETYLVHDFLPILEKLWTYGFVTCSKFRSERAAYAVKYCLKEDDFTLLRGLKDKSDCRVPFRLFSRRPGIGYSCLDWLTAYLANDFVHTRSSVKINNFQFRIDRYLRDHLPDDLKELVKDATYWQNFDDNQIMLQQSYFNHSHEVCDRDGQVYQRYNDLSYDTEIVVKRKRVREMKKLNKMSGKWKK